MKKRIFLILAVAILAVTCVAFVACNDGANYPVTMAMAKDIAMTHTGVATQQIENPTVLVEGKGQTAYYNVEFKIEGVKYTYRVNTQNGDIEKIAINDQPVTVAECPSVPSSNNYQGLVGTAVAQQTAFDAVSVAQIDASQIEVELDFDNGQYLYEVEFVANGVEYEIEIVATTGEVFKVNEDNITIVEPSGTAYIGWEQAKAIALQSAGVEEAQVTKWDEIELEKDKGNHVYEVEFEVGLDEYKYKINAQTGAIVIASINGQGPTLNEEGLIGLERAKEIALASAGVSSANAIFDTSDTKLEMERGKYVYEVSFKSAGYEYEYEIDALTGEILEIEKEIDD